MKMTNRVLDTQVKKSNTISFIMNTAGKKRTSGKHINKNVYCALAKIIEEVMNNKGNAVFAPPALYMTLIILLRTSSGKTEEEILKILNISKEDTCDVYRAMMKLTEANYQQAVCTISSSLWFNSEIEYNEKLLKKLYDDLHVESFVGDMGTNEINSSITEWLDAVTDHMLSDSIKIKTAPDTLFKLYSAVFFSADWEHKFRRNCLQSYYFTLISGERVSCTYMSEHVDMKYHTGEKFTAISKTLVGGYTAIFVLPNEGVTVESLFSEKEVMELASKGSIKTTKLESVKVYLPRYDITSKIEIIEVLKNMGINTALIPDENPKFSKISDTKGDFLGNAEQTTRIIVDTEGVRMASYVEMDTGLYSKPAYKIIRFDRPFAFFINSQNSLPVVAGKLMDPR